MNKLDILLKCLILIVKQVDLNYLTNESNESINYNDLVEEVIELLNSDNKNKYKKLEKNITDEIEHLVIELMNDLDGINKDLLIQTLETILKDNTRLLRSIVSTLKDNGDAKELSKQIDSINRILRNYIKQKSLVSLLNKAYFDLLNNNSNTKNVNKYISELVAELENMTVAVSDGDPAILDEVDLHDDKKTEEIMAEADNEILGRTVLQAGWQDLNTMLQGGYRRGEFVTIAALQHKYKTGFTLSTFAQLARLNTPVLDDKNKKPLIILYSLEDSMSNVINFLYRYLWFNKFQELPDPKDSTSKEKAKFIKDEMTVTGYHIKILKVNPSDWDFRGLFKSVVSFMRSGYEIHGVVLDYLSLIPTTGCLKTGPMGTDMRDLFRRVRNFMSANKILFITPHQISTDAKQLVRNGVSDFQFVKEIAEKGYYSNSRQLDQEIDLELYIHIAKKKGSAFLTVQRGKHRFPTTIPDEEKYFILPFPKVGPIPEDLNKDKISMRSLKAKSDSDEIGDDFEI